jgi:hypothetical protein
MIVLPNVSLLLAQFLKAKTFFQFLKGFHFSTLCQWWLNPNPQTQDHKLFLILTAQLLLVKILKLKSF